MDDSWANPPLGSWRKVVEAWKRFLAMHHQAPGPAQGARNFLLWALSDWLSGELSKWITVALLGATLVAGVLALTH
jgi:hypothetical protein